MDLYVVVAPGGEDMRAIWFEIDQAIGAYEPDALSPDAARCSYEDQTL